MSKQRKFALVLASLGALLGMGISMPSCPGQQALQNQVDALEKNQEKLVARVQALEAQIRQSTADVNNEIRPLVQRMGSTVLNQDKAIKDLDVSLHELTEKVNAKTKKAQVALLLETHYPYSRYLAQTFGGKTYKIVVSSGLTCPTRDGTLAKRGCAFCDVRGSSSFHAKKGRGAQVSEQIRTRIPRIRERFKAEKFLAYFQSYTNTYSDIGYLREIYEAALGEPEIAGLCIGTRPDCLPDACLDLLEEIAETKYVCLELGIQSLENPTLEWLKRGHSAECSLDALDRLAHRAPHVSTCAHLILGSPTDGVQGPERAAQILSQTKIQGVKLHQLMILQNTELAEWYAKEPFRLPNLDEYSEMVGRFLQNLSPEIYIERLCASASHPEECLAPAWSRERWLPHNQIRDYLTRSGVRQGASLCASPSPEPFQKCS